MGNPKVQSSDSSPTTLLTTTSTHDPIGNPSIQRHITPNPITKSSQVRTNPLISPIDSNIMGKQIHTVTRHFRAQQSTEVLELTSNNVHSVSQGPVPKVLSAIPLLRETSKKFQPTRYTRNPMVTMAYIL
jgi:hypothetical protein